MKTIRVLFVFSILILLSGCADIYITSLPLNQGMNDYRMSQAYHDGRLEPVKDQIDLQLICPEICGCFIKMVDDETEKTQKGPIRCLGIPLKSENAREIMIQKLEEAGCRNKTVFFFTFLNDVTKEMLDKSLSSYYKKVNINLSSTKGNYKELNNEMIMDYYMGFARTGNKNIIAKMIALDNNGNKLFDITGNSVNQLGNKHLVWMLPVAILTFPLGTVIGAIILEKKERELVIKTVMEAVDDASRQFAQKSIEFADNGLTQINLLVMIE